MKNDKNLNNSIKDGIANSVMVGAGENYISAYGIALGASNTQVGLLTSIPRLVGSFSQLFSTKITEKLNSRKKVLLIFSLIQSLIWLPIILLVFQNNGVIYKLIAFVTVYWVSSSIMTPAWSSWMGDIVPDKIKGRYFGRRTKIIEISLFLSTISSGLILYLLSKYNSFLGFVIIFSIAAIARFISWSYLKKIDEPSFYFSEEESFSFLDFLKKMPQTNFGKFVIFLAFMSFSVNIASPYFSVYMLRDLKLNYITYTIIISASQISNFFFISVWGKYCDFFGNKRIMSITGSLLFLIPLLWILSKNVIYLVIIQIFSGFIWSGFNISTFNFIFDTVSPGKRVRCVSYYNLLNGLAIFLGASVGSLLLKVQTPFWTNFILLLIISTIGRFLAALIFIPIIKEVKWTRKADEYKILTGVVSEAFEGLNFSNFLLPETRIKIKKKTDEFLEEIRLFFERIFS